jgi:ElaB/YqjD/DUF883 family membrane-anchored ribosome-binding protein
MSRKVSGSIRLTLLLLLTASILVAPASGQESDQALIVGSISSGGLPLEGLEVLVNMAMGETYIPITNATTDSEGRFEVFEDLFGNSFLLEFEYGGIVHLDTFVSVDETYTVDFDLSGGAEFVVLGLDGRGVEGILVTLVNKIGYVVGHVETDSSGSGKFEGLNIGDPFMISLDYEGVPYSETFDLVNSTTASVEVQLLETTTSDEGIEVDMHHIVVEMEGEYLSIWEGITFGNVGDQIFNNSWLNIWLPPEAEEIDSDVMDCCVQNTDEGILVDPMDPIFPADVWETRVEYKIKAKSSKQVLAARMEYDTHSFLYLIENVPGIILESPVGLTYDSEREVSVQFKGLVSWTDALMRNPLVWAGGLLLAPAALLVYFFVLKKDDGSEEPEQPQVAPLSEVSGAPRSLEKESPSADERPIEDLEAERNALMSVLEKIEEDHRKGEISDGAYRSLKSRYSDDLEEIEAELQSPLADDEREDLMAEESAIGSVLEKIASDHDKGLLSERAYNRLRERYEERLAEVRAKLGKND